MNAPVKFARLEFKSFERPAHFDGRLSVPHPAAIHHRLPAGVRRLISRRQGLPAFICAVAGVLSRGGKMLFLGQRLGGLGLPVNLNLNPKPQFT